MLKKCTVKIDDREYAIAEDLLGLLDLMAHYGFF
jgi:hypothetical protein